jgi:hypothetical protein
VGIHEEIRLILEESGKAGLLFGGLRSAARVLTRMAQGKILGLYGTDQKADVCTTCARHTEHWRCMMGSVAHGGPIARVLRGQDLRTEKRKVNRCSERCANERPIGAEAEEPTTTELV